MNRLAWIFLAAFFLHESEEWLGLIPWVRRNQALLRRRAPRAFRRMESVLMRMDQARFRRAVLEETMLVGASTALYWLLGWVLPMAALFLAFTVHLMLHLGQALWIRTPFPAVWTSLVSIGPCLYGVSLLLERYSAFQIAGLGAIGLAIAGLNLARVYRMPS